MRLLLGVAVAVMGAVLAVRALRTSAPAPRSSPDSLSDGAASVGSQSPATEDNHPADLPAWRNLRFRARPGPESIAALADALDADDAWAPLDLSVRDREQLRNRALARLAYILHGSEDEFHAQAAADGATRIDPPDGLAPETIEWLRTWPQVWRDAPVDAAHVVVRRVDYSSDEALTRSMTSVVSRSALSAEYPSWPRGQETEVIEVVVPVRPLGPDGSRRVDAFLVVPYERPTAGGEWRPRRISVYMGETIGGRSVVPPPT